MDNLLAAAGPIQTKHKYRRQPHKTIQRGSEQIDPSLHSILPNTRTPSAFHASNLASGSSSTPVRPDHSVSKIPDKKLRAKVAKQDVTAKRARIEREDVNEWLNAPVAGLGGIEVDEDLGERSWRIKQDEIVKEVGVASGSKKFDLKMQGMGSYKIDYTRNGR